LRLTRSHAYKRRAVVTCGAQYTSELKLHYRSTLIIQ